MMRRVKDIDYSKLPRRSSRLANALDNSHIEEPVDDVGVHHDGSTARRIKDGQSTQFSSSASQKLTSRVSMGGSDDHTPDTCNNMGNVHDIPSVGPVKKRLRYVKQSAVLEEVPLNAGQVLDQKLGHRGLPREFFYDDEPFVKAHVATPSPTHPSPNGISHLYGDDLGSSSRALLLSPGSSRTRIPTGVVDLSQPQTRLLPLRPCPVDTNTTFISTYGEKYYDSKFLFEEGKESSKNEFYHEDTCQGRWSDINCKKNSHCRSWLIEWLSHNIGMRFRLNNETLHVAVGILDRYLESVEIESDMLLCLGCTCMLMAAKLEEEQFPSVSDINNILRLYTESFSDEEDSASHTPRLVQKQNYLDLEGLICNELKFNLQVPLMHHFVDRFLHASTAGDGRCWPCFPNDNLECLVFYYMDLALVEYGFSRTLRSQVVAAAVFLARVVLGQVSRNGVLWTPTLAFYTRYDRGDLEDVVFKLRDLHHYASSKYPNTFTKFSHDAYKNIADKPAPSREELLNHFECD